MPVSPGSARFPIVVCLLLAIGRRAITGESVPPGSVPFIYAESLLIGRRAKGYAYRNFFCFSRNGVGVALRTGPAVTIEVSGVCERLENFLDPPVGDARNFEVSAPENSPLCTGPLRSSVNEALTRNLHAI